MKEYLAHRLYQQISPLSIDARLVKMAYLNPDKPNRKISNYAFFTEHFQSVAQRNGVELQPRGSFNDEILDLQAAVRLALFQFMIGNTDWSIARERNIILLLDPDGEQIPLPYDFDMSGLVNAHYAGPAPGLTIDEVTDRYFMGYCHPEIDWNKQFTYFLGLEQSLLAEVDRIPRLDRKTRKATLRFLGTFFDILHSDQLRQELIVNSCQPWPTRPVDYRTPLE